MDYAVTVGRKGGTDQVLVKDFLVSTDVCSNCIRLLSRFFCKFV